MEPNLNTQDAPLPPAAAGQDAAPEIVQTIEDLRDLLRDYRDLMEDSWRPQNIDDQKRTLILFHRGLFEQNPHPVEQMARVRAAFQRMQEIIKREDLQFHIPTRSGLIPEAENAALADISRRLRDLNAPVRRATGAVSRLKIPTNPELEERALSLFAAMSNLFKAVIRQDWEDVDLVMSHINLVTTSSKSQGVVRHVAEIARDIYNSLNEFSNEYTLDDISHSAQEIPDAVVKLRSVIARLEEYANANLDALDKMNQDAVEDKKWAADSLQTTQACLTEVDALAATHPALAAELEPVRATLRREVAEGFSHLQQRIDEDTHQALALVANMSFQDLTGQTLKKVIKFIEDLEIQLVNLIARHHPESTGELQKEEPAPLEGPDALGKQKLSQENVDKMLADLGF